jgi:hypothetical protein
MKRVSDLFGAVPAAAFALTLGLAGWGLWSVPGVAADEAKKDGEKVEKKDGDKPEKTEKKDGDKPEKKDGEKGDSPTLRKGRTVERKPLIGGYLGFKEFITKLKITDDERAKIAEAQRWRREQEEKIYKEYEDKLRAILGEERWNQAVKMVEDRRQKGDEKKPEEKKVEKVEEKKAEKTEEKK